MKCLAPCLLRRDPCFLTPGLVLFFSFLNSRDLSVLTTPFPSSCVSCLQQEREEKGRLCKNRGMGEVQKEEGPQGENAYMALISIDTH